jgi:hypothetical protein
MELYILYRSMGHPKPIRDNPNKARARASVRMQLQAFKTLVRGVATRAIYEQDQLALFRPIKVMRQKFMALAIKGKHPAVGFTVVASPMVREQINLSLVQLGHRISAAKATKFLQGELGLNPNEPNLKGRAGWDSNIKIIAGLKPTISNAIVPYVQLKRKAEQCNPVCIACPKCHANILSNHKAFQLQDLDAPCRCNRCKSNIKVRDWRCMCKLPWHLCATHSNSYTKVKARNVPIKPCRGTKRAFGPLSHEELEAIDLRRIRKGPVRVIPPAPNILSPLLRERFAHLFK